MVKESAPAMQLKPARTNRGLLVLTIAALVMIQLASLKAHWGDVLARKPDFAAFYGTGRLIREGQKPDYNPADIKGVDVGIEPKAGEPTALPTVKTDSLHPPFESLLFLPLALLPYTKAYLVFFGCNLVLFWTVPLILWPAVPNLHADFHFIAILIGSVLPVSVSLIFGQDSILLLLLLTASYMSLLRGRPFWAGIFLGLSLFKFQLIVPIIAVLFFMRLWKVIQGFVLAFILLLCGSFGAMGVRHTFAYVPFVFAFGKHVSSNVSERTNLMPNLRGLVSLAIGRSSSPIVQTLIILMISAAIFVIVLRWSVVNTSAPLSVRFATLVTMSSIVSYHFYVYNATILILPVLLFANELGDLPHGGSLTKKLFAIAAVSMYIVPVLFSLDVGMPVMACGSLVLLGLLLRAPALTTQGVRVSKPWAGHP